MRITNNMMIQNMQRNMNRNLLGLSERQTQFATGRRINKPSDDPIGISKTLRLRTDIRTMEQYRRNVNDGRTFMDNTETVLRNMLDGMHRIRELTVQAASQTLTPAETKNIGAEIKEIRSQMIDLANYTYAGKHVLSGKKTDQPPLDNLGYYQVDMLTHQDPRMLDDGWEFEITDRERLQVNTLGYQLFENKMLEVQEREALNDDGETIQFFDPDSPGDPLPAGSPLDENETFTLSLPGVGTNYSLRLNHTDEPPSKTADGEWTVGQGWDEWKNWPESYGWKEPPNYRQAKAQEPPDITPAIEMEARLEAAIFEARKVEGEQLPEYRINIESQNRLIEGEMEEKQVVTATPLNAITLDTREKEAVWEIGPMELTIPQWEIEDIMVPTDLVEDYEHGVEDQFPGVHYHSLTFNGAEVRIIKGDPPGGTDIINSNLILLSPNDPGNVQEYADAFNLLAQEEGSRVAGFTFESDDQSLKASAPLGSADEFNRAHFGGTLEIDPDIPIGDTRSDQLITPGEEENRLSFNGVELIIKAGNPLMDPPEITEIMESRNRMILELNGFELNEEEDEEILAQAYVNALNRLAEERGSEVEGFHFQKSVNNGIIAIAPENSGNQFNRAHFSGTLIFDENNPVEDEWHDDVSWKSQLKVPGSSQRTGVVAGQQAALFRTIEKLETYMEEGRQEEMDVILGELDTYIGAMLTARSDAGAKVNRLELVVNRLEDDILNKRELMSSIEDADIAEVVTQLMNEENVYRTSLNVGARVIQPTLLDFLR